MLNSLTVNQLRRLKQARTMVIAGALLGPFYVIFSDGFVSIDPYINATIIGILIGFTVSLLEIFVFGRGPQNWKFITLLLFKTFLYIFLILLIISNVLIIYRMLKYDLSYGGVLVSEEFYDYIYHKDFVIVLLYATSLTFSVNFTRMMSRKMGQGVLLSFITGTYYKPKIQERIFMFLNINHPKEIAEKLGLKTFHNFLNDFFYDITESIVIHRGIIHQYVEDEIVISWSIERGLSNANCARTFFDARDEINMLKERYYKKYGLFPQMRAALHCGNVVRAEIGDVKSEIVFHGDVMNTTSRILNQCYELNRDLLISSHLIFRLSLPPLYKMVEHGKLKLKGKETELELFSIVEAEFKSV